MLSIDDPHDFLRFDVVFEVDFEVDEPETELFSSDFQIVFLYDWIYIVIVGMHFQYIL